MNRKTHAKADNYYSLDVARNRQFLTRKSLAIGPLFRAHTPGKRPAGAELKTIVSPGKTAKTQGKTQVVRGRVELPTHGFSIREDTPVNPGKTPVSDSMGANAGAVETNGAHIEPDLQAVIDAWDTLPEAIRSGIAAMVRTSVK